MEVVAEAGAQHPWDQFKEEVEIMEEEHGGAAAAAGELLTREIRRRLDHAHGSSNGNGNGAHHANAGEEEEEEDDASGGEEEEEQRQQKSIFLDPAIGAHHANGGEEEEEDDASGGGEEGHANGGGEEEAVEEKVKVEEKQQHKSIFLDPAKGAPRRSRWTDRWIDQRAYALCGECVMGGWLVKDVFWSSAQSSTSHVYHSQGTVVKPERPTVESPSETQADPADSPRIPPSPGITTPGGASTTTTETNESYVQHSHVTQQSTVDSSSQHQKTTTTVEDNETTTTVTSEKNTTSSKTTTGAHNASSQTSSSTEYFKQDVSEVVTGKMPSGGAIMDPTHHLIGDKDTHGIAANGSFPSHAFHTPDFKVDSPIATNIIQGFTQRGDIPTSPNHQPADHVVVPVFGGVSQVAPRPQRRDDWDILKAIVYGGLVESVTSLSVVSAAASSGAKTLDIFILGIANLIGGLPLIFHNIADLRDIRDVDGNDEQVGHYWLQLGRRSKARLHMVMALLSYMVFGLLPPVLYGLSFHESNDRENKMMAVAGASLACIALLALGKAHVHTRTYFKTLMYYLMIAVSSSGLSYVAGVLIMRLLVHYGVIEQGGSAAPAPPGLSSPFAYAAGAESSAWASF